MNGLLDFLGRIPKVLLFAAVAIIQVALIAMMVVDRARVLRDGTEVTLATRPVDPRDFLRGDYVVLNYEISSLPAGTLKDTPSSGKGTVVYVKAEPKGNVYAAVSVHKEPVAVTGNEVLIRGRASGGATCGPDNMSFCEDLRLRFGIESYFVPQGEGREIENARNQGKVTVVAAVTRAGRAVIKRLLIDGEPVYQEPLY
ncbi:MAG TPA: GDYXXLXY domain-containing protein [Xanthobacteraceae bacterium]|jgi:uncharacterized membrane-anchored protein|nr:GDYXXLXY domain-containing protein [Xanthobacteraceae bacterium]